MSYKPICIGKDFITSEALQNTELFVLYWDQRTRIQGGQGAHLALGAVAGMFDYPGNEPAKHRLPATYIIKIFGDISCFHASIALHLYCGVKLCSYSQGYKLVLIRALVPHWDISSKNMNAWREMLWINNITIFFGTKMTMLRWKAVKLFLQLPFFVHLSLFFLEITQKKKLWTPSL